MITKLNNIQKKNLPSIGTKRNGISPYYYNANNAQKIRNSRFDRPKNYKKFERFIEYCKQNIEPQVHLEDLLMNFKKYISPLDYPCLKTIYNWAHKLIIYYSWGQKPIKKQRHTKKEPIDGKKNISQRKIDFGFKITGNAPQGHYEVDTVYDGSKKGGALTFNEKATGLYYCVQIPNRKAITVNNALRSIINKIGAHNIHSITSDNGVEFFSYSKVIEVSYNLNWYYCDPYCSSQRGQNERLNRDLRSYYPKGSSIIKVDKHKFEDFINKINNKPRKKFNCLSLQNMHFT